LSEFCWCESKYFIGQIGNSFSIIYYFGPFNEIIFLYV